MVESSDRMEDVVEDFREKYKEVDHSVDYEDMVDHEFEEAEGNVVKCDTCGGSWAAHLRASVLEEQGRLDL